MSEVLAYTLTTLQGQYQKHATVEYEYKSVAALNAFAKIPQHPQRKVLSQASVHICNTLGKHLRHLLYFGSPSKNTEHQMYAATV